MAIENKLDWGRGISTCYKFCRGRGISTCYKFCNNGNFVGHPLAFKINDELTINFTKYFFSSRLSKNDLHAKINQ
jgi:hypothetical protein